MRILHIVPYNEPGLSIETVKTFIPNPAFNFALRVIDAIETIDGVEQEIFPLESRTNLIALWHSLRDARKLARQMKPDVIHAHFGSVNGFFAMAVAAFNAPLVVSYKGSDLNHDPDSSWLRNAVQKGSSWVTSHFAAVNQCISTGLRARLPRYLRKHAVVFPDGIDTAAFEGASREKDLALLGLSVDPDATILLFNGRRDQINKRRDRFDQLVDAARAKGVSIYPLVMEGQFTSNQAQIAIRAADIVVLLSNYEGSPTVIREGMMADCAIVSTSVGDVVDTAKDAPRSFIGDFDVQRFSDVIVELSTRPKDGSHMRLARQRFDMRTIALKWVREVYGPISAKKISKQK